MSTELVSSPRLTVYYDGACPVCRREIDAYRRQRGAEACAWVDVTRCGTDSLGPGLSREAALARLHVRDASGRLSSGARGFVALWQALPATAWLGRLAGAGPMPSLLEGAYRAFLALRRLWRRPVLPQPPWPAAVLSGLRGDHAVAAGALQIHRGVLAVTRDEALRTVARRRLATEQARLVLLESHLPRRWRSRLLPVWRIAGGLAGALSALAGPRTACATVVAVERSVNLHHLQQVQRLDATARGRVLLALRADLERCRLDDVAHQDEVAASRSGGGRRPDVSAPGGMAAIDGGPVAAGTRPNGRLLLAWMSLVTRGSRAAVALARRF